MTKFDEKMLKYDKIRWAAEQRLVEKVINKIVDYDYIDDMSQEIYLILLDKKDEVINAMTYKDLRNFVIQIAYNNFHSKTSPFYKKYKYYDTHKNDVTFDVDLDGKFVKLCKDED